MWVYIYKQIASTAKPRTLPLPLIFPAAIKGTPERRNMALGGLVLGSPILYLKAMRIMMFQLSGFYCKGKETERA